MSLLGELKRRKVFRVAAGYIVFAWVVIQVVETIFPAFGLDEAAFRMLVIVLAVTIVIGSLFGIAASDLFGNHAQRLMELAR